MQISKEQVLKVLEAHLRKAQEKQQAVGAESHPTAMPTPFQMLRLRSTIEKIPEVRQDRIEQIEEQMREGHYLINDDEVAEKIVFRAAADSLIIQDE